MIGDSKMPEINEQSDDATTIDIEQFAAAVYEEFVILRNGIVGLHARLEQLEARTPKSEANEG